MSAEERSTLRPWGTRRFCSVSPAAGSLPRPVARSCPVFCHATSYRSLTSALRNTNTERSGRQHGRDRDRHLFRLFIVAMGRSAPCPAPLALFDERVARDAGGLRWRQELRLCGCGVALAIAGHGRAASRQPIDASCGSTAQTCFLAHQLHAFDTPPAFSLLTLHMTPTTTLGRLAVYPSSAQLQTFMSGMGRSCVFVERSIRT